MPKGVWKDRDPAKRSEAAKKAAASRGRRAKSGVAVCRPRGMAPLSDADAAAFRAIGARVMAKVKAGTGFKPETPGAVAERIDVVLEAMEGRR